jgi:hypothetical protein
MVHLLYGQEDIASFEHQDHNWALKNLLSAPSMRYLRVIDAVSLIPTSSVADAGLTYEIIEISKTTNFPMRVLGYEGRTLVRRVDYSNVKLER